MTNEDNSQDKPIKTVKEYWKVLGPGLTTGAADDDPSGVATYSQVGASRGFGLIWLSFFSIPLLGIIQEMCARIGLVTGKGLAANIKTHYSKQVLYLCTFLLVFANVFNIGADLGAMAKGVQLLLPKINFVLLIVAFALFSLVLQIFISYKTYSKYLKYLALVLITYIFSALSVDINWGEVLSHTFIPSIDFSKTEIILICAVLGTTISPYLFFWQTSQEVEDKMMKARDLPEKEIKSITHNDIRNMRIDVWSGSVISNLVMFFIIAACAGTLFANGVTNINFTEEAALALRPFAGNFAFFLFAIGIIGTGLLAIPVLAGSAAYAVSESFGLKFGLDRKLKEASVFYGVIALAMILGVVMNLVGLNPIKALIYSALLNGIISPVMIFLILRISSNGEIMGEFKNKVFTNIFGWIALSVMFLASLFSLIFLLI